MKCRFNNSLLFEERKLNIYNNNNNNSSKKNAFNKIFLHNFNHTKYTVLA